MRPMPDLLDQPAQPHGTNGGGGTTRISPTSRSGVRVNRLAERSTDNRRAHINPSGYPTTVFGDAASGQYYTSGGQNYDSYTRRRGMQNANDYTLSIAQSENGNNMDIDITATYLAPEPRPSHLRCRSRANLA